MTQAGTTLDPSAPRMIGRYRIDALLGEGAMAHVYLAHDSKIERRLAIKVLKPALRDDADVVRRFLAESRAAGMLSHPNIVTIHDVGEADGVPYIAMEYLDGEPLDTLLSTLGRLTSERVLALAAQITSALALAHRHGVVHRDIKPSNILVCDRASIAKLVDFGIARVDDADEASREQTAKRTQIGQVMGTPRYMSPEQAMGVPVDARSDLFSLGTILYEMVTGKPAFAGNGLATLAMQIVQQDHVPVATLVRDCPRGLAFIIDKLLAKKPGDRFASAEAVQSAIGRELAAMQTDNGSTRRGLPVRVKLPLGLASVTALALGISVGLVLDRQEQTLRTMAIASGSSITDFVSQNVALRVAENAGLPPEQQDWLPLQAFVAAAARDRNVRTLVVIDETGTVRAAGDGRSIGTRSRIATRSASEATADGFHFVRPIRYANADFGRVEMVLSRNTFDAAIANARMLLAAMAGFVVLMVLAASYFAACQLTNPLRRLRMALNDMVAGSAAFRLSHRRQDEFGAVFDAVNTLAAAMEDRRHAEVPAATMEMTRIERPHASQKVA